MPRHGQTGNDKCKPGGAWHIPGEQDCLDSSFIGREHAGRHDAWFSKQGPADDDAVAMARQPCTDAARTHHRVFNTWATVQVEVIDVHSSFNMLRVNIY